MALEFDVHGTGYVAAFEVFSVAGGLEWVVAIIAPVAEFRGSADRGAVWAVRAGVGGVLVLLLASVGVVLNERRKRRRTVRAIGASKARAADG
ncbi:hypothetical protein ACFL59_11950 [Planctomycetota bacterium]